MNKTVPLVTLGIPSYNSGEFLKWTLESVANQTMENFECIVVDDCSTDGSAKYFNQVVGHDPRFRLIRHKMNCGLAASRNTALRSARGQFTAFLDSDDLIMPNSLETRAATCLWAMRQSDRYAGCYSGSVAIEEDMRHPPMSKPVDLPFIDWISAGGTCPFNANQPMLRTDLLRAAGGFNQYLTQSEDYDLWLRLLRGGYTFAPAKWSNITYRKRQGSMIRRAPMTHLQAALALLNSSSAPLGDDQIEWSATRFTAPLHSYVAQRTKMARIFEFCGMSLASDTPPALDVLVDVIVSEMPDILQVIEPHRAMHQLIVNGVRRQTGGVSGALDARVAQLVAQVEAVQPAPQIQTAAALGPYADPLQNLSWSADAQRAYDIAFIPHSGYHVWTISLLMEGFARAGLKVAVIDISPQWRDGGVRQAAQKHGITLLGLSEFALGSFAWKNIIVFNDWDPVTRPILIAAQKCGIRTSAIVEGIQDYDDADVHWTRHAYKTADTVFLPGAFDKKYFTQARPKSVVVGVPRIQALRVQARSLQQTATPPRVLINSNFSYGVLEQHRDAWLCSAVEAVLAAGMIPVISRHPGDAGTQYAQYVTDMTFYECLDFCALSIQRFASGILEALALGVGVIYYNPHSEKVDKFQRDPMGAYTLATSAAQLSGDLARWQEICAMAVTRGAAFLDHHAGAADSDVIRTTVDAIAAELGTPPDRATVRRFREYLNAIDIETLSMTACVRPDGPLFADPVTAPDMLEALYQKNYVQRPETKVNIDRTKANGVAVAQTAADHTRVAEPVVVAQEVMIEVFQEDTTLASAALLRSTASGLLLAPAATLARLAQGGDLEKSVTAALAHIAPQDPAHVHFEKARSFAKASAVAKTSAVADQKSGVPVYPKGETQP